MNVLTKARLAGNLLLALAVLALGAAVLTGREISPTWIWALGALAIAAGVIQFIVSVAFPRSIRPAWDEQTVASHRASYQFGYWAGLIAFWGLFAGVQGGAVDAETALLWLAPILIAAPSLWMAGATAAGRAG